MTSAASAMVATLTALPSGSQLPTNASGLSSGQVLNESNFLQLLTAQLEHQDPLNPMTGDQFAAELAEFSTASGIQDLQTSLTGQEAVGLVGRNVASAAIRCCCRAAAARQAPSTSQPRQTMSSWGLPMRPARQWRASISAR